MSKATSYQEVGWTALFCHTWHICMYVCFFVGIYLYIVFTIWSSVICLKYNGLMEMVVMAKRKIEKMAADSQIEKRKQDAQAKENSLRD